MIVLLSAGVLAFLVLVWAAVGAACYTLGAVVDRVRASHLT